MYFQNNKEIILIIDFGSQVTKLIARRIRDLGVYSEVITPQEVHKIENFNNIKGIILSGGPSTVTKDKYQTIPKYLFEKKIPIFLEYAMVYN
jgi:GMP synthase - Glutamine amidotransferase domain